MKAKKSYGQHFLVNEAISQRIADALRRTSEYDLVVEVGPGKGMLTKYLLEKEKQLLVVEADRDMVEYLKKHYPPLKNHIVPGDFLKTDLPQITQEQSFGLIGNFPYNISSQILFKMLENKEWIPEMAGMFQKEVAQRVIAMPGSKTYGVISVLVQAYYEGEYLFDVGPNEFNPPPKVQSGVIRLSRKANQDLGCSYKLFRRVVKQAFGQRRKMLRNTMKAFIKGSPVLNDPFYQQRPEQLSVGDFVQLTHQVQTEMEKNEGTKS